MLNKISLKFSKTIICFICSSIFLSLMICCWLGLAFADNATGSIKIESDQNNIQFNAYQIFSANIDIDTDNKESVSYIEWTSNESTKSVVVSYITELGCANPENASEACGFIKDRISSDARILDTNIAKKDSFAAILANKIVNTVPTITPESTFNSNSESSLEQGYWLIVSNDSSIAEGKNGSSPIWTSVNNGSKTIKEKVDGISFKKQIVNSSLADTNCVDEAFAQQEIEFELSTTLPSNFESFPHYYLKFEDELSNGLMLSNSSQIKVYDNESDITPDPSNLQILITCSSNFLSVEFGDLVVSSRSYSKDSVIKIKYKAKLSGTSDVVYGGLGNGNTASLTFTNNPASLSRSQAVSANNKTSIYTYKLNLRLRDGNLDKGDVFLSNAKFTIQENSSGKYLQGDGSLGDFTHEFVTDETGKFIAVNIKTGEYKIQQTNVPENYSEPESDLILNIEPTYDGLTLMNLKSNVNGGYLPPIFGNWYKNKVDSDIDTGSINLDIANKHENYLLPTTGLVTIVVFIGIGIALIIVCTIGILRLRKRKHNIS